LSIYPPSEGFRPGRFSGMKIESRLGRSPTGAVSIRRVPD
jgi:hypothetical protein